MRVLILPLVSLVASTCINVKSFSQATCASPQTIATLNGSCIDVTPGTTAAGNNSANCSYNSGGTWTWIRFHPSSATACVSFSITNNSSTTVKTEVALYHATSGTSTCPFTRVTTPETAMCLADGNGVWTP